MTAAEIVLVVIGLMILVAAVMFAIYLTRRRALRERFGPEYERLAAESESASIAERELRDRERQHAGLELRELDPSSRQRYSQRWQEIQSRFVESPHDSVGEADQLVTELVAERGYPVDDFEQQDRMLSVEHSRTIGDYRQAHGIAQRHARGEAGTEELRQALVHFRTLVAELLGEEPVSYDEPVTTARRSRHAS
jgi:hypothetical protein